MPIHETVRIEIVGPYSAWPRRQFPLHRKVIAGAAIAVSAAFAHCIVPML